MQSLFRSSAAAVRRAALRTRSGDGPPGGWWGPGQHEPGGHLFAETPLPPGASRKWEDWELIYYTTMIAATGMLVVGLNARPDTSITKWAHVEAKRRLKEEGAL